MHSSPQTTSIPSFTLLPTISVISPLLGPTCTSTGRTSPPSLTHSRRFVFRSFQSLIALRASDSSDCGVGVCVGRLAESVDRGRRLYRGGRLRRRPL